MIAFFVFFALIIAFIVGCVCISMYLYKWNQTEYRPGHQFVTLHQEALIRERSSKQRSGRSEIGMGECMRRVASISLGIVALIVVLVIAFFSVTL